MSDRQKPPALRRRYRRREITIADPVLRPMTEQERRHAERALGRMFAAMLADEEFIDAERERQRNATGDHAG